MIRIKFNNSSVYLDPPDSETLDRVTPAIRLPSEYLPEGWSKTVTNALQAAPYIWEFFRDNNLSYPICSEFLNNRYVEIAVVLTSSNPADLDVMTLQYLKEKYLSGEVVAGDELLRWFDELDTLTSNQANRNRADVIDAFTSITNYGDVIRSLT